MNKLLLILPLLVSCAATGSSSLVDVSELRWEKRVFLIHSDSPEKVIETLEQNSDEIEERHITWFVITDSELKTNYQGQVAREFSQATLNSYFDSGYGVVLIGKDGGIKSRQATLQLNTLFEQIDAMPMRRSEMRSREI